MEVVTKLSSDKEENEKIGKLENRTCCFVTK